MGKEHLLAVTEKKPSTPLSKYIQKNIFPIKKNVVINSLLDKSGGCGKNCCHHSEKKNCIRLYEY